MRFIWPFKADYRIMYIKDDYSQAAAGRQKRDYVWIMARTPEIPEEDYNYLVNFIKSEGYDISKLEKEPQSPRP